MITVSTLSNVLKKDIAPVIYDQFHKGKILLEKIKQNTGVTEMGSEFYVSMNVAPHSGVVGTQENANLFTGGKQKKAQSKTVPKTLPGVFRISYETLKASRSNKFVLAKELTLQSEGLKEAMQKDLNRQYFGYGNAQIALANGTGGSATTLTVDNPGTDYIYEGQSIIIGTGDAVTVSTIDSATQVTIGTARNWADNDVITKADGDGNAADESMGLDGIVDNGSNVGTFQNIIRSSNLFWNSYIDATGEALSIADMRTAFRGAEKYGDVNLIITTPTLSDKYSDLLTNNLGNVQMPPKTMSLGGGYIGLEFAIGKAGVGVFSDYDCKTGQMFFLTTKMITQGVSGEMEWLDTGGEGGILQRVPGTKDYEAVLVRSGNLIALSCRAHAALKAKTA